MARRIRNAVVALTGGQADLVSEEKDYGVRQVIVFTNLNAAGGATCYLSCNEEAAANTGIALGAGQSVAFGRDSGYSPAHFRWTAYAAAGMNLAVYEETEE